MIPISVRMNGWMRYRDEQVADFSGGRLIAICGENGAGKSSIFDAITYALYGIHRLPMNDADKLISEDLGRLSVEFEFEAGCKRYMVRRSRGHAAGERDQGLWSWDGEAGAWSPVPGTDKQDSLRRVLEGIVPLSAEAFTSSFMLQQGNATVFLDAKPKDRFNILSNLIGLEKYEQLTQRARKAHGEQKTRVTLLDERLAAFGDATVDSAAALRDQLNVAAQREAAAAGELARAQLLHADAERHARLASEVATLAAQIASAQQLIAGREQIEAEAKLFEVMTATVASLASVCEDVDAAVAAESRAEAARLGAGAIDIDALATTQETAASAAAAAAGLLSQLDHKCRDATTLEREAFAFLQTAKAILDRRGDIERIDAQIAAYGDQLAQLPLLQDEVSLLRAVAAALAPLAELKDARADLELLSDDDPAGRARAIEDERARLETAAPALAAATAAAEKTLADCQRDAAGAAAHATTLEEQAVARKAAAAEATCGRCGQKIDRVVARKQLAELTAQAAEARRTAKQAAAEAKQAEAACQAARAAERKNTDALQKAGEQVAEARARADEAERTTERARRQFAEFQRVAPPLLAAAVGADTPAAALGKLAATHRDAPKRCVASEQQLRALHGIEGQREESQRMRLHLASELGGLEGRLNGNLEQVPGAVITHENARERLENAERAVAAARIDAEATRAAEAAATQALVDERARQSTLLAEATLSEQAAQGSRRAAERSALAIDPAYRAIALADPRAAIATLEAERQRLGGALDRLAALRDAESVLQDAAARRHAKLEEVDRIPADHRIDAAVAAAAKERAEVGRGAAAAERESLQNRLTVMDSRIAEQALLAAERDGAALRLRRLAKLVRLLGRKGLQGDLVKNAQTAITSHANAFLQNLTGGALRLELVPAGNGDELELQALDQTCMREPRDVRVLSGSQKFRCAVAIASGIGQYAGAGGMRSIVIDEGFGALDDDGQRQMVEELKNLAAHMDKVIVVSHLEAFRDRDNFPDQILVSTAGTGSRITRSF